MIIAPRLYVNLVPEFNLLVVSVSHNSLVISL